MSNRATRQKSANYSKGGDYGYASNKDEMEHLRIQLTDKIERMEAMMDNTKGELMLFRRKMWLTCIVLILVIIGLVTVAIYLKIEKNHIKAVQKDSESDRAPGIQIS